MVTELDAINEMLSCIGQMPINTLEGTLSYFVTAARTLLEQETSTVLLTGWSFNTEKNLTLTPDDNDNILIPENYISVKVKSYYEYQYVVRGTKLYDAVNHTFIITEPLISDVIVNLDFEDIPPVAQKYIVMSAAYKFVKRELGSQQSVVYTQEDLLAAKVAMEQFDLNMGNYTFIQEYYNGDIRNEL